MNVLKSAVIAGFATAATIVAAPASAASILGVSDIEIGNPALAYSIAQFDLGLLGADYTVGYEFLVTMDPALSLAQIATSGGSAIAGSNASGATLVPTPGSTPTGLGSSLGVSLSSNLLPPLGTAGPIVFGSVSATSYAIDTLQLAFYGITPGSFDVSLQGFSQGYYTQFDDPDEVLTYDLSFKVNVIDPNAGGGGTPVVPVPAGLPLILGALGCLAAVRRRAS